MVELIKELKEEIIEVLNLEDMTVDDIDENEALFGEGWDWTLLMHWS